MHAGIADLAGAGRPSHGEGGGAPKAPPPHEASELSAYRYCTSLLITGEAIDRMAFEAFLAPIGDSALVVGEQRMVKVHVHTNDPGLVLSEALKLGAIGEVEINDMHEQTKARDERLQESTRARRRNRRGSRGRRRGQQSAVPRARLSRRSSTAASR